MTLMLTSLENALAALQEAIVVSQPQNCDGLSAGQRRTIRAGVIQSFAFTYELCWKFMKRWLSHNLGRDYIDGISRHELFRRAAEHRLIEDVEGWMDFHDARNEVSHTYDADRADEVYQVACRFAAAAEAFLQILARHRD